MQRLKRLGQVQREFETKKFSEAVEKQAEREIVLQKILEFAKETEKVTTYEDWITGKVSEVKSTFRQGSPNYKY